jgi:hypothetical protein
LTDEERGKNMFFEGAKLNWIPKVYRKIRERISMNEDENKSEWVCVWERKKECWKMEKFSDENEEETKILRWILM